MRMTTDVGSMWKEFGEHQVKLDHQTIVIGRRKYIDFWTTYQIMYTDGKQYEICVQDNEYLVCKIYLAFIA